MCANIMELMSRKAELIYTKFNLLLLIMTLVKIDYTINRARRSQLDLHITLAPPH